MKASGGPMPRFLWPVAVIVLATAAGLSTVALALDQRATFAFQTHEAAALGSAAGLFPFIVITPAVTWRMVGALSLYHASVWTVLLAGTDAWLVFGLCLALFVGATAVVWKRPDGIYPRPGGVDYSPL